MNKKEELGKTLKVIRFVPLYVRVCVPWLEHSSLEVLITLEMFFDSVFPSRNTVMHQTGSYTAIKKYLPLSSAMFLYTPYI